MNVYETRFTRVCPKNNLPIDYHLTVETGSLVKVEYLLAHVEKASGYHEEIADQLAGALGGQQMLQADHHGVRITTHRPA